MDPTIFQIAAKMVAQVTNSVAGGGGLVGISGTLTADSILVLAHFLLSLLMPGDEITDAGCGVGELLIKLALILGSLDVKLNGFEMDGLKVDKAKDVIHLLYGKLLVHRHPDMQALAEGHYAPSNIDYTHASVAAIRRLTSTMLISFWEGWAPEDKQKLGSLCRANPHLRHLILIQRHSADPESLLLNYNFPHLALQQAVLVRMAVSGQQFHAYIFY